MTQPSFHLVTHLRTQFDALADQTAMRFEQQGQWQSLTWRQFGQQSDAVAKALLHMGMGVQQTGAIFADNSPRWTFADVGLLQIRAISTPIYATSTLEQVCHILGDIKAQVVFVGSQQQLEIALAARAAVAHICPWIITLDDSIALPDQGKLLAWRDFIAMADKTPDSELIQRVESLEQQDLFTLIYTSGTTGNPKGVMLDHANLGAQLLAHDQRLDVGQKDVSLCFLPLAHIFERAWSYYVLYRGACNAYLANPAEVQAALGQVRPTLMCAVPRFYEKVYQGIREKAAKAPFYRRALLTWAESLGKKALENPQLTDSLRYRLADKLVYSRVRDALGGRIRMMPCGGAKLDANIGRFFHAMGINVKLGYGMTETTATVTCWADTGIEMESVGEPMPNTEIKIGANNEILVRGPMVMRGYFGLEQATTDSFDEHGFLKTGDAGHLDERGRLHITDRIKELMKTSGGKYIAPQRVEGVVGQDKFIEQVAIVADMRHFVSALIVPCFEALEQFAKERSIAFSDRDALLKHREIQALFDERLQSIQQELANFEKIKRFTLLPVAFSIESGEITPTLKLRRKVITEKYAGLIDRMYQTAS
ncbi:MULTISPECIES: long-chain fatty acid--CoA ligase [unclassified Vibrio]|uniref:Long-chain fatty acid--CoA ligase n=1 Tax=Vibrio sp. HB236076 TaxID=3232307 RepID=A0AB39HFR1_9VIBR|nr:long-chain fatty acid--CoA ligase [Vibrio sp. HB161653]MDP5254427.1 long-chain fatty acid--CoA ligase [Vibrio sp. HB161653]